MNEKQLPAPVNAFQEMERMDDEQIIAEITGKIYSESAKAMVYQKDNKDSLTKRGLDECCIAMQRKGYFIREDEITYTPCPIDGNFVVFSAKATAYHLKDDGVELKMNTVIGTKRQGLKEFNRNDPFWFEKGSQKALRNARKKLIPENVKADVIHTAKQKQQVYRIKERPAPAQTPSTKPQKTEITNNIDSWMDKEVGFQKTGDLTWRDLGENIKTLPDGSSARSYLRKLQKWKNTDKTKEQISNRADIVLNIVENKKKEEVMA